MDEIFDGEDLGGAGGWVLVCVYVHVEEVVYFLRADIVGMSVWMVR